MNFHLPPHRPRRITLIIWGAFLLAGWNAAKVVALTQQSELLVSLAVRPDPRLRLVVALVWVIVWSGLGIGVWQKRPFTRLILPLTFLLYALYELILTFFFAQTPLARQTFLPQVLMAVLVGGVSWWALNGTAVNPYFQRSL